MNTHEYTHDQLGKVVRFSISVSQMKDLVESRPNPKYQVVSFCCSEINSINIDFLPSFPSKNIGISVCVECFVNISGVIQPFWLGVVSNDREHPRLQTLSKQSIQTLFQGSQQERHCYL